MRIHSRRALNRFLRAVSGLIARFIMKAERGKACGIKFWDARPFTRIVIWGKAFKAAKEYVELNFLEAMGFVAYRPRKTRHGPVG